MNLIQDFFVRFEARELVAVNESGIQADFKRKIVKNVILGRVAEENCVGKRVRAVDELITNPK